MYSLGQVCLLQVLLSSEFPLQVLPNMHLLLRVSTPRPHITEQVHLDQDDQAANKSFTARNTSIAFTYICKRA